MDFLININKRFLNEMKSAAELDSRTLTIIPTLIFMIGAFALIFKVFHRKTHRLTPFKIRFYRELGFHWTYFYMIRIWFLIIKMFKWGISKLNDYIKSGGYSKDSPYAALIADVSFLLILFACSLVPSIVIILRHHMRQAIPDFLMWIGQDPWQRSEIGISGHYLDRPVNFSLPERSEYAYRSKRSTSTEETIQRKVVFRNCKSMVAIKCVRSIEDLLH